MKHTRSEKIKILCLAAATIVTCWNGSLSDSNTDKRPDVNFYGTLLDHSAKHPVKVEDILIGGKYKQIPAYQVIEIATNASSGKELDPKQNKVLLDLDEIASIELLCPDRPIECEKTINNSRYTEIIVTSIAGSPQHYLIESSRTLSCIQMDKGPDETSKPVSQERKLNIIHIKKLIIKGKKSAIDMNESRIRQEEKDSDKVRLAENTEKIIDEIEKNVKNLPQDDPSHYEKFKRSIISLLRSLRDQIQKMLSLIKTS